jgi:ubiquinone/menaquinone biosynthesis C-methylase UbiE
MSFYDERILPWLIDLVMRRRDLAPYRMRAISAATGRVLEVGIGSGLNLPLYGASANEIIGLDPSAKLLAMADEAAGRSATPLKLIEGSAESIPLERGTIDTVVTTWTMCSVPAIEQALGEMRRVLKPGGRLLFVEHGRAPQARVRWWQDYLDPAWKRIAGGCHLNRPIAALVADAGFDVERLENSYMPGPKPMSYMYEGSARPS